MKKHKVTDGNQMKMREALELAITIGDWCCAQTDDPLECCEFSCANQVEPHGEAGADCPWKKIRAALSSPPRNCDVGTAEEQSVRFRNMCNKYYDDENPCNKKCPMTAFDIMHGWPRCQSYWGQMPFKADDCEKTEEEV